MNCKEEEAKKKDSVLLARFRNWGPVSSPLHIRVEPVFNAQFQPND